MQIDTLLRDVENKDLVLPEFQRDFVWNEDDVKKFMQSLYKNYPTGSLLIWKTKTPPKLRGEHKVSDNVYTRVLLDGQQRMTTLYLMLKGKTPPYYPNMLRRFRLYFNVETEEFRYYQKTIMEGKPEWISLIDFFSHESAAVFIEQSNDREYYFKHLSKLTKLESIRKYEYYVDEEKLGKLEDIKEVVRIFNLVNKQGRTLQEEDLALAYVCSFWPEIKDLFRKELEVYKQNGFDFDFNFLILCLNCVASGHAKFEGFYSVSEDKIKEAWELLKKAMTYLLNIMHDKAFIDSNQQYELKSEALLVPLVTYLAKNNCEFGSESELNKFLYWFYNAMAWGRYTRRGKSSPLEQDIVAITKDNKPEALIHNFEREVRYFDVKTENLEAATIQNPLFNIAFIVAKSKGALDWFNGTKLHAQLLGSSYRLHKHHIFPKAVLRKHGYYQTPEKKRMVNEIANRAFLTERANLQIRSSEPKKYLPKVQQKFPKALSQQFVTEKEELWKIDNYEDFLRDRRKRIANGINKFMTSLVDHDVPKLDVRDLVQQDESYNLEFKSSFAWSTKENKADKTLKFSVVKTVVGFLNANGGTLIIGVDDNHNVLGLENDYTANWKGNKDGFLMDVRSTLETAIGLSNYNKYIETTFETIDNKEICVVKVEKSLDPIFIKKDNRKLLYARLDNKTAPIDDPEEITHYIEENWK
ncbi:MAG: hypothetical protein DRO96_01060 [Candidatus Aenigmatarchaeota archaeon]|nr:MAG: hypothetical protein DRO96_01060 [Candidatus Aenigmarchaeota archaeon]